MLDRPIYHDWPKPERPGDLHTWHAGRCAICGTRRAWLFNDHCYRTGLVRGLLCHTCNVREGRSSSQVLRVLEMYRRRPPSIICRDLHMHLRHTKRPARPARWVRDILGPMPSTTHLRIRYYRAALALNAHLAGEVSLEDGKTIIGTESTVLVPFSHAEASSTKFDCKLIF